MSSRSTLLEEFDSQEDPKDSNWYDERLKEN